MKCYTWVCCQSTTWIFIAIHPFFLRTQLKSWLLFGVSQFIKKAEPLQKVGAGGGRGAEITIGTGIASKDSERI